MTYPFDKFEKQLMKKLLTLAARRKGLTYPNPMVAAAVYNANQEILGIGSHQKAGGPHAEVIALNEAGSLAEGQHLMVTLEPCSIQSATPPCIDAIIRAGIRRVVFAVKDPNPLVQAHSSIAALRSAGIDVEEGLCAQEARALNHVFFKNHEHNLPFVSLKMGMSLDGKIAPSNRDSCYITSKESLKMVHRLRRETQAVMIGIGTVLQDDPHLNVRYRLLGNDYENPIKYIVDPDLHCPDTALILKGAPVCLVCKKTAFSSTLQRNPHVTFLPIIEKDGYLNWESFLSHCYKDGICSLLIEGGQQLFSSALAAGVVDSLNIFMAPTLIAGSAALSPFSVNHFLSLDHAVSVQNISIKKCGPDFWIQGSPVSRTY
ncbi:MAG: bifunctional diaminohydroxyphosphoribosylaminopyrimidine deaminase/5-amino-6-(5-phosphoribosylamino)uracil reductase RibD [bacterium]